MYGTINSLQGGQYELRTIVAADGRKARRGGDGGDGSRRRRIRDRYSRLLRPTSESFWLTGWQTEEQAAAAGAACYNNVE